MDKQFYIIIFLFSHAVRSLVIRNESQLSVTSMQPSYEYQCPPWFFYNTATEQCECYKSPNTEDIVKCTCNEGGTGVLLKYGYCMTHSEGEIGGGTFVGKCQYFEVKGHNVSERPGFIILPDNISELNDYMCGPMNRKGLVCSECVEGYGPSVTSLGYSCLRCTWYGIPLYLFIEFVPVTIFYILVMVFRISLTSAPFTAFVLHSQFVISGFMATFGRYSFTSTEYYLFIIPITFYGIFNLDFFRYILPAFCISPKLNILVIVFLGYVSAFYPLCLIGLMWTCIKVHSYTYNFKIIKWCGKLITQCFVKLPRYVNKENSKTLIDTFSTFLLLSYTKLVVIFIAMIEPDVIFNVSNHSMQRVLSFDPSVQWFSVDSLPYLTVSLVVFFVLMLPPIILLAFYPTKRFQLLLSICSICGRSQALLALNTFVEKFYSSYRDGLSGGRDMRGFASLYFFLRIIIYLSSITKQFLSYSSLILGATSILIALVRPYKRTYMNIIDTLILANMALVCMLVDIGTREPFGSKATATYIGIACIIGSVPLIGFLGFLLNKISFFRRLFACVKQKIRACQFISSSEANNGHIENENTGKSESMINVSTSDIIIELNPHDYNGQVLDTVTA